MSGRDKKARRVVMHDFLVATPDALERASASLRWLVLLAAVAVAALVLHLAFGRPQHPPMQVEAGDDPAGALYVRDLGRLADGRHTFDLVYATPARNRPGPVAYTLRRLLIGDAPPPGDVVDLGAAPGAFGATTGAWHQAAALRDTASGRGPNLGAHFRVNARPDQFADVAIGYGLDHERHGWFDHPRPSEDVSHDEQVQFGAVLRAHCALGVKIQHGETRSLCAS